MERIYVGNLPPDITLKDMDKLFTKFGKLAHIELFHRSDPVYAYVEFDCPRNALNIAKSMNGYIYDDYKLQVHTMERYCQKSRYDITPSPPPQHPKCNRYIRQWDTDQDSGFNNNYNDFNREGNRNFSNSPLQSNSYSQRSSSSRSSIQENRFEGMAVTANNPFNPQQPNAIYPSNGYPDIFQQNSNPNLCSVSQETMYMQYDSDNSFNNVANNLDTDDNWNSKSFSNNYNTEPSNVFCTARAPENYLQGLSRRCRALCRHYQEMGLSPEMARARAIEEKRANVIKESYKMKNKTAREAHRNINYTRDKTLQYKNSKINISEDRKTLIRERKSERSSKIPDKNSKDSGKRLSLCKYVRAVADLKRGGRFRLPHIREMNEKIIRDYEMFQNMPTKPDDVYVDWLSFKSLLYMLTNKRIKLLAKASKREKKQGKIDEDDDITKENIRILMQAGFNETDAKSLAILTMYELKPLLYIKKEYDIAERNKLNKEYHDDLEYLNQHKSEKIMRLTERMKIALYKCIIRMHKYEKENHLPLTQSKFISMILDDNYYRA